MSLRSDIQDELRLVIADLGETWQYRRMTSGPSAQTRTYGSWTNVVAHASARGDQLDYDQNRQNYKRTERMRVRVSDALAILHVGDQLKDTAEAVWAVLGISSNVPNTGTIAYDVERTVPLKSEAGDRNGGV
jgi:hypothetical protein